MQRPPLISSSLLASLQSSVRRLTVLVEFYTGDTLPTDDGFDPDAAVWRISTNTTTFLGNSYARYLLKAPTNLTRSITEKFNSVTLSLDNHPDGSGNRVAAAFVLNNPVEGMYCVIRVIPRDFTPTTLADSFVVFWGICEKPYDATNNTVQIQVKSAFGYLEPEIPWRDFGPEDEEGRESDDPLFEGFLFTPITKIVNYTERVLRGGVAGLLGMKKTVNRSSPHTSHSDVSADDPVPLVLGRSQVKLRNISVLDVGNAINQIAVACEGPVKEVWDFHLVTPGYFLPGDTVDWTYGYPGGTNGQEPAPPGSNFAGDGYYSHSVVFRYYINGSEVGSDDPAAEASVIILGLIVPVPDTDGDFTLSDVTDNPAFLTRWALTHPRLYNLDPAFINDEECLKTACFCDYPVLDDTNSEVVVLPSSVEPYYGPSGYVHRYNSTGLITPEYVLHYFLGVPQDPLPEFVDAEAIFYDPTTGAPELDVDVRVRRRFTANHYLKEKMKVADWLNRIHFPTYRGFLTTDARGKVCPKSKRPADATSLRDDVVAEADELPVLSILPWLNSLDGYVVIGADTSTSEVRAVTEAHYSTAGNSITLAVSAGLTASGATFSGGNNTDTPATASVTVTGTGTLTVTIDGVAVTYVTRTADTTETAAYILTQYLRADPVLKYYVKASWDSGSPTVISLESKLGVLVLADPLVEDHADGDDVIRVEAVYADKAYNPDELTYASLPPELEGSNIIRGSVKWPISGRQSSVNRIDSEYVDSPLDFALAPLRTRDADHVAQVRKVLPKKIDHSGVDNYSQAKRLQAQELAELRDMDFFMQFVSVGEALLHDEGDIIVNTHGSGAFRNLTLRIEEVVLDLDGMKAQLVCRRYLHSGYSDVAPARNVPLPTSTSWGTGPPEIEFDEAGFPPNGLTQSTSGVVGITTIRGGAVFGDYAFGGQYAKVSVKRPGETSFTQITTITPLAPTWELIATDPGPYEFQLEVCAVQGTEICNVTKPTAVIVVGLGTAQGLFDIPLPTISGAGGAAWLGTGALTVPRVVIAGAGIVFTAGGGSFDVPQIQVSGTGTVAIGGSGSFDIP